MARINFEDEISSDPRFKRLVRALGDEDKANGMLLRFWRIAQKYWGEDCALVPEKVFHLEQLEALIECHLAEVRDNGVYAVGSEEQFEWYLQRCRANRLRAEHRRVKANAEIDGLKKTLPVHGSGSPESSTGARSGSPLTLTPSLAPALTLAPAQEELAGVASAAATGEKVGPGRRGRAARGPKPPAKTAAVWEAYREAYRERHGIEPAPGAKVRTQMGKFIDIVGEEDAPAIAAFYVWHNKAQYVEKGHDFGICLLDAVVIRKDWMTGTQTTRTAAHQVDKRQNNVNVFSQLHAEAKAKESGGG